MALVPSDLTLERVQSQKDCKVESNTTKKYADNSLRNFRVHYESYKKVYHLQSSSKTTILTNAGIV